MRKSQRKINKDGPRNHENRGLEGVWSSCGSLGGPWELFREVLADFAQFGPGSDRRNLAQKGQDGAKIIKVEAKTTILKPFGRLS